MTATTTQPTGLDELFVVRTSPRCQRGDVIAFTLAEVHRFMRSLRILNIEIAVRNGIGKLQ